MYTVLPDPAQEPWPAHPVWDCNIIDNKRKEAGYDYKEEDKKKWEDELRKRRQ